ncbi:MAG: 2-oxoacid:acceptor oxidoreductase family protein [Gammaproteobacteria bacterium]|nr:2-oxoacid:acceptor oxidoreductase family protein [Gammaproteobacteria bacterium]
MYRIRFHGRGGQGMKTASRILGTAFFLEGYEVQDAPRYGAERRGAPIFAYVRADKKTINERGIINQPDLVIIADDTLVPVPAAGVLAGVGKKCVVLINSVTGENEWKHRLGIDSKIVTLPVFHEVEDRADLPYIGATCAGAAASLIGIISRENLNEAIAQELGEHGEKVVEKNCENALKAFDAVAQDTGSVREGLAISATDYIDPQWIQLPFDEARISAPTVHAAATSVKVNTGVWRTMRPVIDYDRCSRCWWVCSTFCPDGAINVSEDGQPQIDYDHCKGCLVCVAQCPPHAIEAITEHEAQAKEQTQIHVHIPEGGKV